MFHCNGWTFPGPWRRTQGPTSACAASRPRLIFDLYQEHKVTHYCGAPIVHSLLINAPETLKKGIGHKVHGMVAAAAPPAAMIEGMERMGFDITHVYGLTEVYGPATVCAKQEEWNALDIGERTHERPSGRALPDGGGPRRDGPRDHDAGARRRRDHGRDHVPRQHHHEGLPQEPAGHRGGLRRRLVPLRRPRRDAPRRLRQDQGPPKDIIISGGENISSLEVEDVLYRHPAVLAAAVVAKPDPRWGETPCAFVELKPGAAVTESEIIDFAAPISPACCRAQWCSASCPRPPPARSRNSCCARRRARRPRSIHERSSNIRTGAPARGARRHLHADHEPAGADESAHLRDAFRPAVRP